MLTISVILCLARFFLVPEDGKALGLRRRVNQNNNMVNRGEGGETR